MQVEYTSEEKQVLAEMLKNDRLEERRQKARREQKQKGAAQRRAVLALEKEFRAKSALDMYFCVFLLFTVHKQMSYLKGLKQIKTYLRDRFIANIFFPCA